MVMLILWFCQLAEKVVATHFTLYTFNPCSFLYFLGSWLIWFIRILGIAITEMRKKVVLLMYNRRLYWVDLGFLLCVDIILVLLIVISENVLVLLRILIDWLLLKLLLNTIIILLIYFLVYLLSILIKSYIDLLLLLFKVIICIFALNSIFNMVLFA